MELFKINELVNKSGLPKETIRYYERLELIAPDRRDANNYRLYSNKTLEQLSYIAVGKKLAFTLKEIKMILEDALYRNSLNDCDAIKY